jgi:hypothetical protein
MKKLIVLDRFILLSALGYVLSGVFQLGGCGKSEMELCSTNEAPTITVRLYVNEESILSGPVELSFKGEADVLEVDPVTGPAAGAMYLDMVEDGTHLRVSLRLPPGVRYPISPGDRVNVEITVDGGGSPNMRVKVTGSDGKLLIYQYAGEFDGDESEANCKPVEVYCGKIVYVPKSITVDDPSLEPEERVLTLQPGEQRVLNVGEDKLVVQMGAPRILVENNGYCTDPSATWAAYSVARVKK